MFLRHKTSYLTSGAIAIIFLAGILFFGNNSKIPNAKAAATDNVRGFAWSQNIGWISFNSLECDTNNNTFIDLGACGGNDDFTTPIVDYGVNLNADNTLSGYAWSSNIGWISFNKIDTGVPPGAPYGDNLQGYIAKLNGNNLTGWARALSFGGGWDGWIKLRKDPADAGADYGVSLNGTDFEGFAWGDMVVGWMSFNSKNCNPFGAGSSGVGGCPLPVGAPIPNYKVYVANNNAPDAINFILTPPSVNDLCNGGAAYEFRWTYFDPEGGAQSGYRLQVDNDSDFSSPTVDRTVSNPPLNPIPNPNIQPVFMINVADSPDLDKIAYGVTAYYWQVQVWDNLGKPSGWKYPPNPIDSFVPPDHLYPDAGFSFSPPNPTVIDNVSFAPNPNAGYGPYTHDWDFDFNTGIDAPNDPNPFYNYGAIGVYNAYHKVTDIGGEACEMTAPVNVGAGSGGLKWEEVIP